MRTCRLVSTLRMIRGCMRMNMIMREVRVMVSYLNGRRCVRGMLMSLIGLKVLKLLCEMGCFTRVKMVLHVKIEGRRICKRVKCNMKNLRMLLVSGAEYLKWLLIRLTVRRHIIKLNRMRGLKLIARCGRWCIPALL